MSDTVESVLITLVSGLEDMIDGGRLLEGDIPDDMIWLRDLIDKANTVVRERAEAISMKAISACVVTEAALLTIKDSDKDIRARFGRHISILSLNEIGAD